MSDNKYRGGSYGELRSSLTDPALVVVPLPPLLVTLHQLEKEKGFSLTEQEVLSARDRNPALIMDVEDWKQLVEQRRLDDLDPDDVWAEWQAYRLTSGDNGG